MRTFLKGKILFNGGASSMDCLIRDLSATGAKLELSETSTLPEVFDLYIAHKDATHRATLRWRRDGGIGVTFEDPGRAASSEPVKPAAPAPDPVAPDASLAILARRIAELEAENAALRTVIASMGRAGAAA